MRPWLLGSVLFVLASACATEARDPREAELSTLFTRADESLLRTRPALVEGKYARMASSPFEYFRGSMPVYKVDTRSGTRAMPSRFGLDVPLVPSVGDPHPENFGVLRASDGTLGLEPNDFDAADRAPYLWDVRRFVTGLSLAASQSNEGSDEARAQLRAVRREIAREGAVAYRDAVVRRASGEILGRFTDFSSPILADLAKRADRDRDARRELTELTVLDGGLRRFRRGPVDPEDPQSVLLELPSFAAEQIPRTLERYRKSLVVQPSSRALEVLDSVRELGSGVASFPRVRILVLVRGESDDPADDIVLEVKELSDSGLAGLYPPGIFANDVQQRIVSTSRGAWARPDAEPRWGTSDLIGFPVQVRLESQGQKNVRVSRMVEARGTKDALTALARALGYVLARIHTQGDEGLDDARLLAARFGADPEGFADELADFGASYSDGVLADYTHFVAALRHLGMRLGMPDDPSDRPSPELRALYGTPPPPMPLPELP